MRNNNLRASQGSNFSDQELSIADGEPGNRRRGAKK